MVFGEVLQDHLTRAAQSPNLALVEAATKTSLHYESHIISQYEFPMCFKENMGPKLKLIKKWAFPKLFGLLAYEGTTNLS